MYVDLWVFGICTHFSLLRIFVIQNIFNQKMCTLRTGVKGNVHQPTAISRNGKYHNKTKGIFHLYP